MVYSSNFSPASWSNQGCHLTFMNDSVTVCSCNHLSHFAVLVQFDDNTAGNKDSLITKVRRSGGKLFGAVFTFWRINIRVKNVLALPKEDALTL